MSKSKGSSSSNATAIQPELTQKIAELAKLELTEKELKLFTPQLQEILNYVEALKQVDVEGVSPLFHLTGSAVIGQSDSVLREDQVSVDPQFEKNLGGYRVPPVL